MVATFSLILLLSFNLQLSLPVFKLASSTCRSILKLNSNKDSVVLLAPSICHRKLGPFSVLFNGFSDISPMRLVISIIFSVKYFCGVICFEYCPMGLHRDQSSESKGGFFNSMDHLVFSISTVKILMHLLFQNDAIADFLTDALLLHPYVPGCMYFSLDSSYIIAPSLAVLLYDWAFNHAASRLCPNQPKLTNIDTVTTLKSRLKTFK